MYSLNIKDNNITCYMNDVLNNVVQDNKKTIFSLSLPMMPTHKEWLKLYLAIISTNAAYSWYDVIIANDKHVTFIVNDTKITIPATACNNPFRLMYTQDMLSSDSSNLSSSNRLSLI